MYESENYEIAYFEFLQGEHVFQYDDLIPPRAGVLQSLGIVIVPIGKFAKQVSA